MNRSTANAMASTYSATLTGLRSYLEARRDTLEREYLTTGDERLPFAAAELGAVLVLVRRIQQKETC